jgi:hypothetical protein
MKYCITYNISNLSKSNALAFAEIKFRKTMPPDYKITRLKATKREDIAKKEANDVKKSTMHQRRKETSTSDFSFKGLGCSQALWH